MNKLVNFEDNVFILTMRIRMVRDIITLDADPELFLEKTLDDIYFADHTLKILLDYLKENHFLIERAEHLEHFSALEWQFSQILSDLLENNGNLSTRNVPSIQDKLGLCKNNSFERQKSAEKLSSLTANISGEPMVSSDELTELLKAL
jgi:hypothetical protein